MSPNQGYHINVAKNYSGETSWPHTTGELRYVHYCNVYIGDSRDHERAVAMLNDTSARYPAPEFKCTMTLWTLRGEMFK